MKTITKKTAKNGATLYYIDGKRASRDKAIEISKNADNEMLTNALGANVELKDAQAILVISTEAPLEVGKDREFGWCFTNVVDAVEAAKKVATLFGDRFIRAYIMGDAEHFDNRIIATVDKAGNVEIKKQTPTYIFTDYQIIRGINPDGRTEHTETFATYCRELGDDDNFTGLYRAVTYYEEDDSSGWDIKTADGKIIAKGNTKAELQEAFENIKTGNVEVSEEIAEINAADVKINVADNGKIIEQIKVDVDTAISIINRLNYRNDTFIYCNTTREDNADIKYRHFDAYRDTGEKDGLALTEILINGKLEIVRFFNLFRDITVDLQIGNVNYTIGDKGAIVLTADNTPPDNEPMSDDISDICKYNPDLEDDNKPCRLDWDDSAIAHPTGEEELAEFNALPAIPAGTLKPVIIDNGKTYTEGEYAAKVADVDLVTRAENKNARDLTAEERDALFAGWRAQTLSDPAIDAAYQKAKQIVKVDIRAGGNRWHVQKKNGEWTLNKPYAMKRLYECGITDTDFIIKARAEKTACDLAAKLKEVTRKARLMEIYPQVGGRTVDNLHKVEIALDGGGFIFTNVYETLARYDTKEQCLEVIRQIGVAVEFGDSGFTFPKAADIELELNLPALAAAHLQTYGLTLAESCGYQEAYHA